jgi:hypothetical protein
MFRSFKSALPVLSGLAALAAASPSLASDVGDVAREMKLPAAVVEGTFANVDAFFAAANGPANRLVSGTVKELALKAIRHRQGNLEDSAPGKASEASAEEKHAVYKAVVRTTRHETTETRECVDNKVTISGSEGVPAIKDGSFTFDTAHPRLSSYSWDLTFCRTPTSGGGYSDWAPATGR